MSNTKRLFIGIPLPEEFKKELLLFQEENEIVQGIRWVSPGNLHITLCFIGDYEVDRIPELSNIISDVTKEIKSFNLNFKQLTFGPNFKKAYMLWATFISNKIFVHLFHTLNERILSKKDNRDPIPHITLCRFKNIDKELVNLDFPIEQENLYIDRINLYESLLQRSGAEYSVLQQFKLI